MLLYDNLLCSTANIIMIIIKKPIFACMPTYAIAPTNRENNTIFSVNHVIGYVLQFDFNNRTVTSLFIIIFPPISIWLHNPFINILETFTCDRCDRTYMHKCSLYKHQKWECGKECNFKCSYCSYGAKQKISLKNHVLKKHSENFGVFSNN